MKTKILNDIANKLIALREEANLTQSELAKKLNITRDIYSNYEIARVEIPLVILNKIANFYQINIDYILGLNKKIKVNYNLDVDFQILATNLKTFMKENNLKIASLALDANTTISTIWAYLHNKKQIRVTYLYLICQNNHLSVDTLLERIILVKN